MCVIIYCPVGETIDREELMDAWTVNSDGAGYCYQKDGEVIMERGFMDRDEYIDEVQKYIGKYNIALHFRITTSKQVNKLQTHPYCIENINLIKHHTKNEVVCMNGIVGADYNKYVGWNDTMCYIKDHKDTFHVANKHILDMIEEETGCRWLVMRPNEVLLSKGFIKQDGKYYSNTNHLWTFTSYYTPKSNRKSNISYSKKTYSDPYDYGYDDWTGFFTDNGLFVEETGTSDDYVCEVIGDYDREIIEQFGNMDYSKWEIKPTDLFTKTMIKKLKSDDLLWATLMQYMYYECNDYNGRPCGKCMECFETLKTKQQITDKLNEDYGIGL